MTPAPLLLNRVAFPVTTLGPGRRAGIWVQTCSIGCPGCMSRDTWAPEAGEPVAVAEILRWLAGLDPSGEQGLTGVTISGGEPFEQPVALAELLAGIRAWSAGRPEPVDVMAYSGFTGPALRRSAPRAAALHLCDVVVTGPYLYRRAPGGRWRGSDNQRLEVLTELGRARFGPEADSASFRNELQVVVERDTWTLVGVPGPGQLERLESGLRSRGIDLEQVSWRAGGRTYGGERDD